jgi:hypothetical protein
MLEASCDVIDADRMTMVVQVELQRKLLQEYEKREQKRKVTFSCSDIHQCDCTPSIAVQLLADRLASATQHRLRCKIQLVAALASHQKPSQSSS